MGKTVNLTPFPFRLITTSFLFLRGIRSEMISPINHYYISLFIMTYFEGQEVISVLSYCEMSPSLNEVYPGGVLPSAVY